jgi:ABC-type branched-subunit amino acid transport system ATPase component
MTVVLETTGLKKSFGGVQVIDDLSVQLNEGEALGIVGPNGAGKTTLFNLITGVYRGSSRVQRQGHHASVAAEPLPRGHRPHLPDPQAVRRHERFRERARVRRLRAGHERARQLHALR